MADYKTVKGWLTPRERERLYTLARGVKPDGAILNIGVEYGASVVCLAEGCPSAQLFAMDIDTTKLVVFPPKLALLTVDSSKAWANWKHPLDLLFVDGDHGYDGVKADLNYLRHVIPDGIAVFHDCYDHEGRGEVHPQVPGVNRAVMQWFRKEHNWEELEWTDSMRVFQRIK